MIRDNETTSQVSLHASTEPALLDAAASIGRRLISSALWNGNQCSWSIVTGDRSDPWSRRTLTYRAGPDLYQGVAGIAVYLIELLESCDLKNLRPTIEGALESVISESSGTPATCGFYVGSTGRAYALARYGALSRNERFFEEALAITSSLSAREPVLGADDVISGAAGAIPVLLKLSRWLAQPGLASLACDLGLRAVAVARRWPRGWSWLSVGQGNARDLCGYAHGASGYAYAFLELFKFTREDCFLYAARQALVYERTCFDEKRGNWLDYRNSELEEALSTPARREQLRARLLSGASPPWYRPRAMNAWCHGPPGIGMVRLHAAQVLDEPAIHEEALVATDLVTRASSQAANYSLCHGVFGNDEFLFAASEYFGRKELREAIELRAASGAREYELRNRPWPSGTSEGQPDPSLLLGDAGIGYHLLRLTRATMPSVLFPTADPRDPVLYTPATEYPQRLWPRFPSVEELHDDYIARYFGRTRRVFAAFEMGLLGTQDRVATSMSPAAVLEEINLALKGMPDRRIAAMLDDATAPDQAFCAMMSGVRDFSEIVVAKLMRPTIEQVEWNTCRLGLTPFARLVVQQYDWDAWLNASQTERGLVPERCATTYLVLRLLDDVVVHRLSPFAAAVLSLTAQQTTVARVAQDLTDAIGQDALRINNAVLEQLKQAFAAGLINIDAAPN